MDGDTYSEVFRFVTTNYVLLVFILVSVVAAFLFAVFEPKPKSIHFPIAIGLVGGLFASVVVALVRLISSSPMAAAIFVFVLVVILSSVLGNAIGKWIDRRNA
jgi:hypothetical protein